MKLLVVYHKMYYSEEHKKAITKDLGWIFTELVEDILFLDTVDREGMEVIDFKQNNNNVNVSGTLDGSDVKFFSERGHELIKIPKPKDS